MGRKKGTRTHLEINKDWQQRNTKAYSFRFNVNNQSEVIEHLEAQENKAGFVADLILKDYLAKGGKMHDHKVERLYDIAKEMTENDNVVLIFKDGSKLYGGKKAIINDSREVERVEIEEHINGKTFIVYVRYA